MASSASTEVIVVGAGPTGLFLAGELATQGIEVVVLEREAEPDQTIKAGSINVASAELLDRRGLLPAAEGVQRRLLAAIGDLAVKRGDAGDRGAGSARDAGAGSDGARLSKPFPAFGHFAGMFFRGDLVDQDDPLIRAHTAAGDGVLVPQRELEHLLAEHCVRLGVTIRRGVEVRGVCNASGDLNDDADVVLDTDVGEFGAHWVVAADGGRSALRKQLGIDFVGTGAQLVGYQAVADFDDPGQLKRGWTWTPRGIYAYGPMPGRILVAKSAAQPAERDAPVSLDELQDVVREVTGTHVTLTALRGRATRWSDNARQAQSYRRGRVLLAGDAAHVHSPFSGQGLNLGLGDAANLGWKLAATIQQWAPTKLLDTYESERHPIAAGVLDWTRAQVALMRGDEFTAHLRAVVADELLTAADAVTRMVALTAGIAARYEVDADEAACAPVGSLVGDAWLTGGRRFADFAHGGHFVLVDRSPDGAFAPAAQAQAERICYVADPAIVTTAGAPEPPSLLVRPDGVIIWAARRDPAGAAQAVAALVVAIRRWAGSTGSAVSTLTSAG